MDAVLGFLSSPVFLTLAQVAGGFLMKRNPKIINKTIPFINFGIAFIIKAADAFLGPGQVHAADVAFIAALPPFFTTLGNALWQALLQTLLATGIHSAAKNTGQIVAVK